MKHGIVEIDADGTWWLPSDLEAQSTDDLMAAFQLTYEPPGGSPFVGSFQRAMHDIREALFEVLEPRGALERA